MEKNSTGQTEEWRGRQEFDDAQREYRALLAKGDRILAERELERQRIAAVVQGFRTRDEVAFRLFRNEKLEHYKTLFELSARYAYLAANAYDYETGLLNNPVEGLDRFIQTVKDIKLHFVTYSYSGN